jgi:signal transduction histidine kinase/tetratricopeptide (TPR) repeat protein
LNFIKKIFCTNIVFTLLFIGKVCYANSDNTFKVLSEFAFQKSKDSILYNLYNKADSLFKVKKFTTSLKFALKIIDASKQDTSLELVSNTNYLVGKIWYASAAYDKAIVYFKKSVVGYTRIFEEKIFLNEHLEKYQINDDFNILNGNLQIGKSYQELFELFIDKKENNSISTLHRKKALFFYDKILKSSLLSNDVSLLKSKAYNNISGIYLRDSAYMKAKEYLLKSLEIKKRLGDKYLLASGYNALSNIYFYEREYETSKKALSLGLKSIENIKGEKADEIRVSLFMNMAYSMYKLKDYLAYDYQHKSWELYDKLKDLDNQQRIADIYADRNFDRGLQEGIFQQEIKRQKAQRTFWISGIGGLIVILSLLYALNYYKLRQKNLSLQLSQTKLLQNRSIEKIKSESQIRILNATIDGKEAERKQIAETLHDNVSALLSSANLHLQAAKPQFNDEIPLEIDKTQKIIIEASQKIRDLSHTLVSSVLLKFGLDFSIKDMADKYSNSQIEFETNLVNLRRYDQGFEIKFYNIIQEFINNILKHSKAERAIINLAEVRGKLSLKITDNGIGFDKTKITVKEGLGLSQIDARIQLMKGEFTIDSSLNNGTTIKVILPILEKE